MANKAIEILNIFVNDIPLPVITIIFKNCISSIVDIYFEFFVYIIIYETINKFKRYYIFRDNDMFLVVI